MHKKNKYSFGCGEKPTNKSVSLDSPSPDKKSANRVQPTHTPMAQIQRYYKARKQQKTTLYHRNMSVRNLKDNHAHQYKQICGEFMLEFQEEFWRREEYQIIGDLIRQLGRSQQYVREYEGLVSRNKRLEQQMFILLKQLQNIHEQQRKQTPRTPKTIATPSRQHHRFLQDSHSNDQDHFLTQIDVTNEQEQKQNLYEYIESMQNTITGLKGQISDLQTDLKKNVRKDVTDMQQRLMNYIFSLEEKLVEASSHKKVNKTESKEKYPQKQKYSQKYKFDNDVNSLRVYEQNPRQSITYYPQYFNYQNPSSKSQFQKIIVSDTQKSSSFKIKPIQKIPEYRAKQKYNSSSNSNVQSVSTPAFDIKKYSNGSVFHLDISDSYHKSNQDDLVQFDTQNNKLLSSRKSQMKSQTIIGHHSNGNTNYICKNCLNYLKQIRQLQEKVGKLETQLKESKREKTMSITNKVVEKLNILQSQVDVMVEQSSVEEIQDALEMAPKIKILDRSIQESLIDYRESSSAKRSRGQKYYIVSEIRGQLTNLLQDIQQIIHYCESQQQKNKCASIIEQLTNKINLQAHQISEYEEDIGRLRLEVLEAQKQKESAERLMKMRIREEDEYQPPSFRLITEPISCVDHKTTKKKLDHILESIRTFQRQVNSRSAPGLGLKEQYPFSISDVRIQKPVSSKK